MAQGDFSVSALTSPAPTTSWQAIKATGGVAADAQIAVSTTHVVVTNRTMAGIYDKAGTSLGSISMKTLFSPLGLDSDSF
jgi:hypothetical protein